jgi:hypothetical protein
VTGECPVCGTGTDCEGEDHVMLPGQARMRSREEALTSGVI